jgi:hypothetical protein
VQFSSNCKKQDDFDNQVFTTIICNCRKINSLVFSNLRLVKKTGRKIIMYLKTKQLQTVKESHK